MKIDAYFQLVQKLHLRGAVRLLENGQPEIYMSV